MVEEDTIGRVVQGDDGEYYIVVEDGSDGDKFFIN